MDGDGEFHSCSSFLTHFIIIDHCGVRLRLRLCVFSVDCVIIPPFRCLLSISLVAFAPFLFFSWHHLPLGAFEPPLLHLWLTDQLWWLYYLDRTFLKRRLSWWLLWKFWKTAFALGRGPSPSIPLLYVCPRINDMNKFLSALLDDSSFY